MLFQVSKVNRNSWSQTNSLVMSLCPCFLGIPIWACTVSMSSFLISFLVSCRKVDAMVFPSLKWAEMEK